MVKQTFACPNCNTSVSLEGTPGQSKQITCPTCGTSGRVTFRIQEPESPIILSVSNFTKTYGTLKATDHCSFNVHKGEIFGFLGPNGAGKTTTIRCILDFIYKDEGMLTVFGLDSHKDNLEIRRRTGYLPGDFGLPPNITVDSYLHHLLSLSDVTNDTKLRALAKLIDLDLTKKTNELSKGNKQKVGIVQAFMANQDLIILDEPTSGLDPLIQQRFYRLLQQEQANGKTIFMSSHVLSEVELICDRVAIINNGRIIVTKDIATLQEQTGKVLEVEFKDTVPLTLFTTIKGVTKVEQTDHTYTMTIHENLDQVIKTISKHNVLRMDLKSYSLEELFLKYYTNPNTTEVNP